ncbi:MAG: response regulator [Deltaproteobacteria bacterium]|nr:response regulator [Deltaproteobacteria bacterium]
MINGNEKRKKILLVDDSNFFLEVEKDFFNRTDCNVITANNGVEALKIIESDRPDMILMDLYMREMRGDECCRKIKENPLTKDIPIVIVTHSVSTADREQCKEAGCDDFIVKPINKATVLDRVRKFIGVDVREYEKAPISTEVIYAIENSPHKGYAYVISEEDIYIKGDILLHVGNVVKIIFNIAGIKADIEAECEVVWTTSGRTDLLPEIMPGMVMKFISISKENREYISSYVNLVNYIFSKP